ncbi:VanZ family protein [Streptococcaceae bacterium ESL0687]|nr:VanZ family protein [Streptococcaceae bacterium ESL0687]
MNLYIEPIQIGVMAFFGVALLAILPYFVIQYRKKGGVGSWKLLVTFSFILYILCAYALTIFPLPSLEEVKKMIGPKENLHLFAFVEYFKEYSPFVLTDKSTWLAALKHWTFFQPFFNVLLTLPFGFYLAYLFRKKFWSSLVYSFLLTLSFELIQRSALFGYYPRPYRLFDVDDLLLNTTGAILGYSFTRLIEGFLPKLDKNNFDNSKVTFTRRFTGLVIDGMIFGLLCLFLRTYQAYLLVFLLIPFLLKGSLGQHLVKISIEGNNRFRIFLRLVFMTCNFIPLLLIFYFLDRLGASDSTKLPEIYVELMVSLSLFLIEFLDLILAWINGSKRLWFERISHTRLIGE